MLSNLNPIVITKGGVNEKCDYIIGSITILHQPTLAAEPATIAAIFSKTGIAAASNADTISGVELAVEEINRQGGVLGRPLKLTILDNRSTPIGSIIAAQEAVRLQSMAVIGADWSSHSLAIGEIVYSLCVIHTLAEKGSNLLLALLLKSKELIGDLTPSLSLANVIFNYFETLPNK